MSINVDNLKALEAQWEAKNQQICDLLKQLYPVQKELRRINADLDSTRKAVYDERHGVVA